MRKIGQGSFATVYLADQFKKKRTVAIKAFKKAVAFKDDGRLGIENEINLMRKLKSNNLVSLHGVF